MTKIEFLNELQRSLTTLDAAQKAEIRGDFEEHFNEGKAQGLSEEDICKSLGQPGHIAEQLLEVYRNTDEYANKQGDPGTGQEYKGNNNQGNSRTIDLNDIGRHVRDALGSVVEAVTSVTDAVGENIRESYSSQSGTSGGSRTGEWYDISINKTFPLTDAISIALKGCRLNLYPNLNAQSNEITVQIQGRSRHDRFHANMEDNVLVITEDDTFHLFDFIFSRKITMETNVWLPAGFVGSINANVSRGELDASNISGSSLTLKNSTRKVKLSHCRFNSIHVQATAGNLECSHCEAHMVKLQATAGNLLLENNVGVLDAHTTAGNINLRAHTGGPVTVKSSAGDVTVANVGGQISASSAAGNIKLQCEDLPLSDVNTRSAAGNVKVFASSINNLYATSAAGNVNVQTHMLSGNVNLSASAGNIHVEAREVAADFDVNATTGAVTFLLPDHADCRIEAQTRMGSVTQRIKGNPSSSHVLRAKTSMGSITFKDINKR